MKKLVVTKQSHLLLSLELKIKNKVIHQEEILMLVILRQEQYQYQKATDLLEEVVEAEEKSLRLEVEVVTILIVTL
jgi:hypothetical protein